MDVKGLWWECMRWVLTCKCFSLGACPRKTTEITVSSFWWINVQTFSPVDAPALQCARRFLFAWRTENSFPHHPSLLKARAVWEGLEPQLLVKKEESLVGGPRPGERRRRAVLAVWGPPCCQPSKLHRMLWIFMLSLASHLLLLSPSFSSLPMLLFCLASSSTSVFRVQGLSFYAGPVINSCPVVGELLNVSQLCLP